jgi:hypothetical protein
LEGTNSISNSYTPDPLNAYIYITGVSYSGSTLLCALLGTHHEMVPVSELSKWTAKHEKPYRFCSCGKKDIECDFWVSVEKRWLGNNNLATIKRYAQLQEKFERQRFVWLSWWNRDVKNSSDFREFEDMTVSLFEAISSVSGCNTIIDSSKRPGRAFVLSKMDGLDLSIIHLLRNSLGYLDSSHNRRRKSTLEDPKFLLKATELGLRWTMTNLSAERVLELSNVKSMRVMYEDLVTFPAEVIDEIGVVLNVDVKKIRNLVEKNKPVSYQHMASGSGHRCKGAKPIVKEYNRTENHSVCLKAAFYLGAGLFSHRYGYFQNGSSK